MLVKNGEGIKQYSVIQNGIGEILKVFKFGPDETGNRCKFISELWLEPGQCTGLHAHTEDVEIFYMLEGELACIDDGTETVLRPGDCTVTSNGQKHQIINKSDKIAKVLAVVMH